MPKRNRRELLQEIIARKALEVQRWASETLDSTEEGHVELTDTGIGMLVYVRSIRATELLLDLYRQVFRGFSRPTPWLEDSGEWSAWYGYGEPLESPNYVRLHG